MNAFWSYFWPVFALGLVAGLFAGFIAFRRSRRRNLGLAAGLAASLVLALLWHGPGGAANRFASRVERQVHEVLNYYEVPQVTGQLHRNPLTRRLLLSGPADDFQRSELVRLLDQLPGVSSTSWSPDGGGIPLVAEGAGASVLGFLLGLVLAYLIDLRRRYNAQWKW